VTSREEEIPPEITHVLRVGDNRIIASGERALLKRSRPGPLRLASRGTIGVRKRSRPSGAGPALIELRDVKVQRGEKPILRGIDWRVGPGENWLLLGPNGAGKTTLLSLILGDNPAAYEEEIHLFGRRRGSGESIWDIKKKIGHVSPELQLAQPRDIDCFQLVCSGFFHSIGLYRRCSARQAQIARSWMKRLGISHLSERPLGRTSAGEGRLALLARALVNRPLLLILDEPCQDLDGENRGRVIELVDKIGRRDGTQLIYVTHRPDEVPGCINHVLRLAGGRVTGSGPRVVIH